MFEALAIAGIAAVAYALLAKSKAAGGSLPSNVVNILPENTEQGFGAAQTGQSVAIGSLSTLEKSLTGSAVAGGSAAAGVGLSTGLETAGIGAAVTLAALGIGNLVRCGTITSIGCTKRNDTDLTEEVYVHARIIYQYFLQGAITADVALQGMAQLAKEAQQYLQRASDYNTDGNGPCHSCGNFTTYNATVAAQVGHPPDLPFDSPAYHVFCNYTKNTNLKFVLETGFPNLIKAGTNGWQKFPQYFNGGSLQAAMQLNAGVTNN